MRISNNNPNKDVDVSGVAHSKKSGRAGASKIDSQQSGESSGVADAASVSLSGEAKTLAKANKLARTDDVDQAKIDKIKAMIDGGTYKPDYGKVADKMVNEQLMQELA